MKDFASLEDLIQALKSEDPETRRAVAAERFVHSHGVEPFIQVLKFDNHEFAMYAAEALGKSRDKRAFDALLAVVRDKQEDELVRLVAGWALQSFEETAFDALLEVVRDEEQDWAVRGEAALFLAQHNDARVYDLLIAALAQRSEMRKYAAMALGSLKDKRAIQPLTLALDDKKSEVRDAAARALTELNEEGRRALVNAHQRGEWRARRAAAKALKLSAGWRTRRSRGRRS